jgi:hypothetical protein
MTNDRRDDSVHSNGNSDSSKGCHNQYPPPLEQNIISSSTITSLNFVLREMFMVQISQDHINLEVVILRIREWC